MATAGVMLLKGPQARQYTQKAVHTQGGTHKRRSVATARVMLFKGLQARRDTKKAVHTQGEPHKWRSVAAAGVVLLIYGGLGGLLVYGGITTRGGYGLSRTFGRPKVRPDFQPFFRPKQGGGLTDQTVISAGRKSAKSISPPNPRSGLIR